MQSLHHVPSHNTFWPTLAVIAVGILWGSYWMPLRWLDETGAGGGWISLIYSLVMMLAAIPWLIRPPSWQKGLRLHLFSGVILGTAFALYTLSLLLTDVIHTIMLFYLTPVWSTLAGVILFGKRLTFARALAIILGFTGMTLILGFQGGLPLPRNLGDWMAFASGVMWTIGGLRLEHQPHKDVAAPTFCFGLGGVVSSLIFLWIAQSSGSPLSATEGLVTALPLIIASALIFFVPPNALVLWASQRLDAGRVGILLMGEVLVGAVTAALFSGEAFGWGDGLGALAIAGAGIVEVLGRQDSAVVA